MLCTGVAGNELEPSAAYICLTSALVGADTCGDRFGTNGDAISTLFDIVVFAENIRHELETVGRDNQTTHHS